MNIEAILVELGFGKYQKRVFVYTFLLAMISGIPYIMNLLATEKVQYRCFSRGKTESFASLELNLTDHTTSYIHQNGSYRAECFQEVNLMQISKNNASTKVACKKWVYDTTDFSSSVVTDFDLTCDRDWLRYLARSLFMTGMFLGSFVSGAAGDRYGRKVALTVSMFIMATGTLICSISVNISMFLIMQVLLGAAGIGNYQAVYLIGVESVSSRWRNEVGIILGTGLGMGKFLTALIGYFEREWRLMHVLSSIPVFLAMSLIWLIPTSPRWLLVKEKQEKIIKYFEKAAKVNGVSISKELLYPYDKSPSDSAGVKLTTKKVSWFDLFKFSYWRNIVMILLFGWFSVSVVFYGITQSVSGITGTVYVNIAALLLTALPSAVLAIVLNNRIGRKWTLSCSQIFSGSVCVLAAIIPEDIPYTNLVLNACGQMGINVAYASLYLYTAEIFPTQYRGLCLGVGSVFSRLGGIVSPCIIAMALTYKQLPFIFMGGLSLANGVFFFMLPETRGSDLPQTLEDCQRFRIKQLPKGQDTNDEKVSTRL